MTAGDGLWTVRLTASAEADFGNVIDWTRDQFGERQARIYSATLIAAFDALTDGPTTIGVKERPGLGRGLFTFHIARGQRRGRHFLLFRVTARGRTRTIEVLRILHNAIDLERHVPER